MFKKKNFTLIELIVVIAVLGILASIVIPNISNMQEKSKIVAMQSDIRNVQTAVDMYFIENNNEFPTYSIPALGKPAVLDFEKLKVDFLRQDTQFKDLNWWVDEYGIVYCSAADYPTNIVLENGSISWDEQEKASKYRIYKVTNSATGAATGNSIQLMGETENSSFQSDELTQDVEYFIEAVDTYDLTTPKFGKNYKPVISEEPVPEAPVVWPAGTYARTIGGGVCSGVGSENKIFDGNPSTGLTFGGYEGTIEIVFPEPTLVKSLKVFAGASPTSLEYYTYSGYKNGEWIEFGTETYTVLSNGGFLGPYKTPEDKYEKIRISIAAKVSWVSLGEVYLNQ